jgi:hypothetical protein
MRKFPIDSWVGSGLDSGVIFRVLVELGDWADNLSYKHDDEVVEELDENMSVGR